METQNLTRRDFIKAAAGTAAAAAIVAAGGVSINVPKAFADTVDLSGYDQSKSYTITANLYVRAELNSIIGMDAYLTNLTTPSLFGTKPTTPASDNAVLTFSEGKPVVTINSLNNTFGLTYIATTPTDGGAEVTEQGALSWNKGGHETRIQPIGFTISDTSKENYVFDATEYADFTPYRGDKSWEVTLLIDWTSIK